MSELDDKSETTLEMFIKNLEKEYKKNVTQFTPDEIATYYTKIPEIKTMLELRNERSDKIESIIKSIQQPSNKHITERKIEHITQIDNKKMSGNAELTSFFSKRKEKLNRLTTRLKSCMDSFVKIKENESCIAMLLRDISHHLSICENFLSGVKSTRTTYDLSDVEVAIQSMFMRRQKNMMLDMLTNHANRLKFSHRHEIASGGLLSIEQHLTESGISKIPEVIFYVSEIEDLNAGLTKYGKFFGVSTSIEESDGEYFLYYAQITFNWIWNKLENLEFKKEKSKREVRYIPKNHDYICDEAFISQVAIEERVQTCWEQFELNSLLELNLLISEFADDYNHLVRGKIKNNIADKSLLERKKPLPVNRITMFFKLRTLKVKVMILHMKMLLNYFEAIYMNMNGNKHVFGSLREFDNIIAVYSGDNSCVYFSTAQEKFEYIMKKILQITSYYCRSFESETSEKDLFKDKVMDNGAMIEELIELYVAYFNAKRKIIQPLYEIYLHHSTSSIKKVLFDMIEELPTLHINEFNSYKYAFRIQTELMNVKADVIRTLVNSQIIYSRHIDARSPECVPIFERLTVLPIEHSLKYFPESVPIIPFELCTSLSRISKLIKTMDDLVLETVECLDVKKVPWYKYFELSSWKVLQSEIKKISPTGVLHVSVEGYSFQTEVHDIPCSIIRSPILNDMNVAFDTINNINEARRIRYAVQLASFLSIGWELQDLIIEADCFQHIYIMQCSKFDTKETNIFMGPFKNVASADILDSSDTVSSESILNVAMIDFDNIEYHFDDVTEVSQLIASEDTDKIDKMLIFQRLHSFLLETAIRYNFFSIDNEFLVEHFGFTTDDESDVFLTQSELLENSTIQTSFVRAFMSANILMDSTYITEIYRRARAKREWVFCNIRQIKSQTRVLLNAQAKHSNYSYNELFDLYIHEMIDSFSSYAYRVEVAFVSKLQRHILLQNSFVDVFIIDLTKIQLVNEAGRVGNHFIVHLWVDIFGLVRTAPLPRQAVIFKSVLQHIVAVYRIFRIARFEASLNDNKEKTLISLLNFNYKMEVASIHKLLGELNRLPSGNEFDICSKYCETKLEFYMKRLELASIMTLESSFLSNKYGDSKLRDTILSFLESIYNTNQPLALNSRFFSPDWTNQFLSETVELNRSELGRQLAIAGSRIEAILSRKQAQAVLDSYQAMKVSIEYLNSLIQHLRLKFFLFMLNSNFKVENINDPLEQVTQTIYREGLQLWNTNVIPVASKLLTPEEEESSVQQNNPVTEDKVIATQLQVTKNICDSIILVQQINNTRSSIEYASHLSNVKKKISRELPDAPRSSDPESFFKGDYQLSQVSMIEKLRNICNDNIIDGIINEDNLQEALCKLSTTICMFNSRSIETMTSGWRSTIMSMLDTYKVSYEDENNLDFCYDFIHKRYNLHLKSEIAGKLYQSLLTISSLEDSIRRRKKDIVFEDIDSHEQIVNEYDKLLEDLVANKLALRKQFIATKNNVYNIVQKRISVAEGVQFVAKDVSQTSKREEPPSNEVITSLKEENKDLSIRIKRMRIIRCLSMIASKRFFIMKIASFESDKKTECSRLWESKKGFEAYQTNMKSELQKAYKRLADSGIEIEKLKQILDNEKQSTIQLVHWKAINSKREVELDQDIKKYEALESSNIDDLLDKIKRAESELQELKSETEPMEEYAEDNIRRPMTVIEKFRKKIASTIIEKSSIIQQRSRSQVSPREKDDIDAYIAAIREENKQIGARNASLQNQIEQLEHTQANMSIQKQSLMYEVQPSPRIFSRQKYKGITRPNTVFGQPRHQLTKMSSNVSTKTGPKQQQQFNTKNISKTQAQSSPKAQSSPELPVVSLKSDKRKQKATVIGFI